MISIVINAIFLSFLASVVMLNYRVGRFLNLSLGSLFALGAYLALIFPPHTAAVSSVVIGLLIGLMLYAGISRFSASLIDSTLMSLGFGIAIEEILRISFRSAYVQILSVSPMYVNVLGENISLYDIYSLIFSVAFIGVLLSVFILPSGLKVKFVEEDYELAEIYGVDTEKIRMYTISLTSSSVTFAGFILSPTKAIDPTIGWPLLITSIIIAATSGLFGGVGMKRYASLIPVALAYSFLIYALGVIF